MCKRGAIAVIRLSIVLFLAGSGPGTLAVLRPQIQTGTVRGTITDPAGAVLGGARILLDNSITGFQTEASSDGQGLFAFDNLPFDSYRLRVTVAGFKTFVQPVSVRSNIPVEIDVKLTAAGASETVIVGPGDQLVEADSASTETDIDESLIQRLPGAASNRRLQQVIAITPGWSSE